MPAATSSSTRPRCEAPPAPQRQPVAVTTARRQPDRWRTAGCGAAPAPTSAASRRARRGRPQRRLVPRFMPAAPSRPPAARVQRPASAAITAAAPGCARSRQAQQCGGAAPAPPAPTSDSTGSGAARGAPSSGSARRESRRPADRRVANRPWRRGTAATVVAVGKEQSRCRQGSRANGPGRAAPAAQSRRSVGHQPDQDRRFFATATAQQHHRSAPGQNERRPQDEGETTVLATAPVGGLRDRPPPAAGPPPILIGKSGAALLPVATDVARTPPPRNAAQLDATRACAHRIIVSRATTTAASLQGPQTASPPRLHERRTPGRGRTEHAC